MEGKMAENQSTRVNDNKNTITASPNKPSKKKGMGLFSYLFPILLAISIIFGIWAYFIKTDKFGLGESMRPTLINIPVIKNILPASPDPESPLYMSQDELIAKYKEYRAKVKELSKKIEDQKKVITDLEKYKDNQVQIDKQRAINVEETKRIGTERKQLQADKLKFANDIKNKDKKGFTDYFEKLDKDVAQQLYEKVMKENQVDAQVSNYVKTFEGMEPAKAAKVLENMGYSNMDLVANIIKVMKKQAVSQIIVNMDPLFAANLEDRIAVEYPIYPSL
jgi:flagellar motility protein MotE (MotC chaperone)